MKSFALIMAAGLLTASCADPTGDPVGYLKAIESGQQQGVNVIMEEVGFWQKLCAEQSPKWTESAAFCKARAPQVGHLCLTITALEEARKSGKKDCMLG